MQHFTYMGNDRGIEWPTLGLMGLCYAVWLAALWAPVALAVPVLAVAIALHASLQHEAIHGHPFRDERVNAALMWAPLTLTIPYARFRETHLAHHQDSRLTDPYDDPESNYLDAAQWEGLGGWRRMLMRLNNTLLGRILLGPLIGNAVWLSDDARRIAWGDRRLAGMWAAHLPCVVAVLVLVALTPLPVWAYLVAVYGAQGLLKIRTFLEHQAHDHAGGRSAIVEDRGPLALLFLNNNLHVVHHMHPRVPWYRLPTLFRANRARYLGRNGGYYFASYAEVFGRYWRRAKDPVVHPLWRRGGPAR
ncbi:MAG: fatty acid desaturase [Shimia sp.]